MELVEYVARAICKAEKMNPDDWVLWKNAAQAAIEAMREFWVNSGEPVK